MFLWKDQKKCHERRELEKLVESMGSAWVEVFACVKDCICSVANDEGGRQCCLGNELN